MVRRIHFFNKHSSYPKKIITIQKSIDFRLSVNEQWVKEIFQTCQDVKIQRFHLKISSQKTDVLLIYCEGLCDAKQINSVVIPSLRQWLKQNGGLPLKENEWLTSWNITSLQKETGWDPVIQKVFDGELVLLIDGLAAAFTLDLSNPPKRTPEDANTELSIRGPRDAFIEELSTNVALIRKRMKTNSLAYEQFLIGERSQTKVGLLYIQDVIRPEVLANVKRRLLNVDIDALQSSNQLEELLSESILPLFPVFDYTGRPDKAISSLLRGRFVILVDGSPTAIIAPVNLVYLVKSPEDLHFNYMFVSFQRLFRLIGLGISLFLPGFFVAITTYHQDQVPLTLLATLVVSRKGIPFPSPVEALIMILAFELFMEAGLRLPSQIGQTLGVVGALIIGDAAIRAGLTSPVMLVITGTTAVASFTLINQSLSGSISVLRLGILFVSSVLGIYGFLLSVFSIIIYLSNLRSFGVPYMAPISPVTFRDFTQTIFRTPGRLQKNRPSFIRPVDLTRRDDAQ